MSFLGLGGKQVTSTDKLKIEAAETELDTVADLFNRLIDSCHRKCISGYGDGQLTAKEGLCLDRCVGKYFEVNAKIGEQMQQQGQQFMASQRR